MAGLICRISRIFSSCQPLARPSQTISTATLISITDQQQLQNETDSKTLPPLEPREWAQKSRRTGVIAIKLGMTHLWDNKGNRRPVTLLQVLQNQVVQVRTVDKEGYSAVQVGAVDHSKPHKVTRGLIGHFASAGVSPKRKLFEFKVSEDALLPPGTSITAAHFSVGQYVDVNAVTRGKGFQGVMKRHGMAGQPASHGATKTHRKMGATGGGQDPGRIWPGKRMPGRMGGQRRTVPNLKVYRINHAFNVLYVNGAVPGPRTQYVKVRDAFRKPRPSDAPFPTHIPAHQSEPPPEEAFSDDLHLLSSPTIQVDSQLKQKK